MSEISASHSRSNITTHNRTLDTVSRIIALLLKDLLDSSYKFSKDETINWNTTCIFSSSYGASGAVILVISLKQEARATFTSTLECLKSSSATNALIIGESASCMDLAGDCSTFVRKDSASSSKGRSSSTEEGGLRSLFPASANCSSSPLPEDAAIFSRSPTQIYRFQLRP
nr:hypothetical protein L195_g052656 [Ipomoea batatas]